jgi:predicted ATP-binding protein involved in virulence
MDRTFGQDDIRLVDTGSGNTMELAKGGVAVEAEGIVDYQKETWSRRLAGPKARTTRKDAQVLTTWGKELQDQVRDEAEAQVTGTCLPLVACYPTDRLWNIRRLPYKKLPRTSRMVGYTHCLQSGSDFRLMADWFRYWSYSALEHHQKVSLGQREALPSEADNAIEAMRKAIDCCLKPSGWSRLDFSIERQELVANHPEYGELPVGMLSDGIRSMLTLVADIAFRMVKLNPNLGPYATRDTCGIVLIDEVDMHLHPAWQQIVLTSLREAFPRIQFIVTTHSPQVTTTVPAESLRILTSHGVAAAPPGTEGAEAGRLLESVFGVDPRPTQNPATQELLRYLKLVDDGHWKTEEALTLRKKLDQRYQGTEPALLEADLLIENKEWEQQA